MGIADFSFLQAFTAWNLSVPMLKYSTRRIYNKREVLVKWQFYSVAAEEMMSYVDLDEAESIFSPSSDSFRQHAPRSIPKDYSEKRYPHCIICSMEESVLNKLHPGAKSKGARKLARRKGHLAVCSCIDCKIIAHTCSPDESMLTTIQKFLGMSCF